mmetsp:Transcript_34195/g.114111  ORF Transcript_34195/g.114111 Transcript_34195/m.114111 type:complete len:240 (+) Transcript_34195:369-1088(+)
MRAPNRPPRPARPARPSDGRRDAPPRGGEGVVAKGGDALGHAAGRGVDSPRARSEAAQNPLGALLQVARHVLRRAERVVEVRREDGREGGARPRSVDGGGAGAAAAELRAVHRRHTERDQSLARVVPPVALAAPLEAACEAGVAAARGAEVGAARRAADVVLAAARVHARRTPVRRPAHVAVLVAAVLAVRVPLAQEAAVAPAAGRGGSAVARRVWATRVGARGGEGVRGGGVLRAPPP